MPLYEYICNECEKRFEILHISSEIAEPECPACHSGNVKRILSRFAARVKTEFASCPSGRLNKNRDQLHAKYGEPDRKIQGDASIDGCPYQR